ncbi:hypothetical protein TeGR_g1618 [Tetraparma gracilis]|uniref:Pterin-binding domain-containing protein n=1 Tax=Tetraparma gracilis TaxID=2962635 RepID=A0ABQ6NAR7_9STRA|nr:hypothetical protein TeGR_g1618 [Tetraparma gracilis]
MYVTEQPSFLNAVAKIETALPPPLLLGHLKSIEAAVGRVPSVRNGPRLLDLDILSHGGARVETPDLQIPHPRIGEREFVLRPLRDVDPRASPLLAALLAGRAGDAVPVLPLPRDRLLPLGEPLTMGILNATPDSFSDGGLALLASDAAAAAGRMIAQGAHVLDIGGESTRPGAPPVAPPDERERLLPVIRAVREAHPGVPISVDTRNACTARAAVGEGADLVNDVSGGRHDPAMFATVAELGVPMCIMHSRGDPQTMGSLAAYTDVVPEVAAELLSCSALAAAAGVHRWQQVLDVGIGFAKDEGHNLALIARSEELKELVGGLPLLVGASRKGFIGAVTGEKDAKERDFGTVAAHLRAASGGAGQILRVHNVKGMTDATRMFNALNAAAAPPARKAPREREEKGRDATAKKPSAVCDPYENGGKPLSYAQCEPLLPTLAPEWTLVGDDDAAATGPKKLVREIEVQGGYMEGAKLMTTLAAVALNNDHYYKVGMERRLGKRKWSVVVKVECETAVLGGLSFQDFLVAGFVDTELERLVPK